MAKLTDEAEILFRQIHPNYMSNGMPSSDRFRPTSNDGGRLSVDRSALVSAAESHELYVSNGRASTAVFGVSVGECLAEQLPSFEDPIEESSTTKANPAHAVIDFSAFSEKDRRVLGRRLQLKAIDRGQLHPQPAT